MSSEIDLSFVFRRKPCSYFQSIYFPEFGLIPGNDFLGIGSGFAKFNQENFWERFLLF
jgi:hypothetical protein